MKKIIIISYLSSLTFHLLPAQGVWTQKVDFSGTVRSMAVGFSIGSKGYIGTGEDSSGLKKDFWEYNSGNNTWTQKTDFDGTARRGAVGFAIGGKGYIGTGEDANGYKKDFWEYDTINNLWIQKSDFAGTARNNAVGFSIGSRGYIGTGQDNDSLRSDFWEYDTTSDSWSQKANFGGTARSDAVGFSIGGKGYIGTGEALGPVYPTDFWEYDTLTDSWTQKANISTALGNGRYSAIGFSINNKGYMGTGFLVLCGPLYDFYEYVPSTDTWNQKADYKQPQGMCAGFGTWNAVGFSIGNKGYVGTGEYTWPFNNYALQKDFWEYDPDGVISVNEEENKAGIIIFPNPFSIFTKILFKNQKSKGINYEIKIYDLSGKKISPTILKNTDSIIIHRDNLEAGVYYLIIRDKEDILVRKKILVMD